MWPFKNKNKKKDNKEQMQDMTNQEEELPKGFNKSQTDKASYKIEIYESINGLPRRVSQFTAKRIVDENDYIPYLYYQNQKTKKVWLEIFPQKDTSLSNLNEKDIDKKINDVKQTIKNEYEKEYSTQNMKDLEFKLKKLEAKKRTFMFSFKSSYIYLDENNMPVIKYNREGSNNIPFKWDTDNNTIYLPSDNKKKNASITLRNKENKYPTRENQVRIATMVLFIVAFLIAGGAGFWHYKAFQSYDNNEINKIKEQNLEDMQKLNHLFQKQGQTMQTILNNMSQNIVVTSSTPKGDSDRPVNFDKNK